MEPYHIGICLGLTKEGGIRGKAREFLGIEDIASQQANVISQQAEIADTLRRIRNRPSLANRAATASILGGVGLAGAGTQAGRLRKAVEGLPTLHPEASRVLKAFQGIRTDVPGNFMSEYAIRGSRAMRSPMFEAGGKVHSGRKAIETLWKHPVLSRVLGAFGKRPAAFGAGKNVHYSAFAKGPAEALGRLLEEVAGGPDISSGLREVFGNQYAAARTDAARRVVEEYGQKFFNKSLKDKFRIFTGELAAEMGRAGGAAAEMPTKVLRDTVRSMEGMALKSNPLGIDRLVGSVKDMLSGTPAVSPIEVNEEFLTKILGRERSRDVMARIFGGKGPKGMSIREQEQAIRKFFRSGDPLGSVVSKLFAKTWDPHFKSYKDLAGSASRAGRLSGMFRKLLPLLKARYLVPLGALAALSGVAYKRRNV